MSTSKTVLVTGGAGYIGSHIAWLLAQQGYQVVIIDDLSQSSRTPSEFMSLGQNHKSFCPNIIFYHADFANTHLLSEIFTLYKIDAVMHCAAFIEVGQSVKDPLRYYDNNVSKTITLLRCMQEHGINRFIFSSSCAVYGIPQKLPLTEDHPKNPISPYGNTKLMVESILRDCATAYGLQYVALRYFNAAGATPELNLGERHIPESHLIPLLLRAALYDKPFTIFGNNYPTPDGTCLRDFLHVRDIAQAHLNAFEYLQAGGMADSFNLGIGNGVSVQQMITMVEQITQKKINVIVAAERAGDPPILAADSSKAQQSLAWSPRNSVLEYIVQTAHDFEMLQAAVWQINQPKKKSELQN